MKEKIKSLNYGWIVAIGIFAILLLSVYVTGDKEGEDEGMLSGKHYVVMTVKDYGEIKMELDADIAPITVTNFIDLVKRGFYDGLTFHRIIEGFMIQGGNGTGGSGEQIKGEFASNGYNNNLSHVRGTVSMARGSYSPDSASSQFFIVQENAPHLDGEYAAFGTVTEGMDVVDKIAKDAKPTDNNGSIDPEEQPVIEKIKVVE